ncbi:hypothetical protein [Asticcacaulis excentricus]|uniref:Uncharacterized protein n=1 Tax=Asticcacaulis excentricus (strain ATCC 15261 / DSM 4724 / KCTC 12464 / NCIMB 9791 / VKM B-1370 / CB 48) TaxID=573065 RepID=E8RVU0_ASTEC|nr:hypothetical protein [Asticcacaulis excentricus]ADU15362.1 hypothetical protein Astex_3751 [Asticcacaulis excentricus CB 48]
MQTQFHQTESKASDVAFDAELEAMVTALERQWAAEREAREAAFVR